MTETSGRWDGTVTGDAQAYCKADQALYKRLSMSMNDPSLQGVVYTTEAAYNGQLECTNPVGLQIQVDTGMANVYGYAYWNDAAKTLTPALNGFYRVVLQRDYVAQTTRAVLIYNAVATPAPTYAPGGIWEIPLANFEVAAGIITAAGVVDERTFINAETKEMFVHSSHGYNTTDGTNIYSTTADNIVLPDTKDSRGYAWFNVREDFISNMTVKAVYNYSVVGVGNDLYGDNLAYYGACGEAPANHTDSLGLGAVTGVGGTNNCRFELSLSNASIGDIVRMEFRRDATNILDDLDRDVQFYGFLVEYFGYKR